MTAEMQMFNIDDAGKRGLEALPETGMGFQLVEAMVMGDLRRLLVFNSEKAIDLSGIELSVSNDPAIILRNGIRIVELLKSDVRQTIVMSPAPHSFKLLSMRIPPLHGLAGGTMSSMPVTVALPSSLVKHVKLKAPRAFHRFSAFAPDRRVNPLTGDFLPGTYRLALPRWDGSPFRTIFRRRITSRSTLLLEPTWNSERSHPPSARQAGE
jgi:hypothetical protein